MNFKSYFYRFVLAKSALSATLLAIIIGFFIAHITDFQLDASSDSLILEGDSNLRYYQSVQKNYPADEYVVVSYQTKNNLLDNTQLAHLKRLQTEMQAIKQVKSVTTILDVPLFRSPPLSLIELASKNISISNNNANLKLANTEFKTSPFYANHLVSKDGKTTAVLISLKSDQKAHKLREKRNAMRFKKANNKLTKTELSKLKDIQRQVLKNTSIANDLRAKTIAEIRHVMGKYTDKAHLFLGGLPMISTDIIAYISNDLLVFSLAVLGLMLVVLALIFKAIRWVLIPIGISISAALTMTGILGFLDWKVTVISSNFFSLLLVMTLSITIHLIVRYRELAQNNPLMSLNDLIKHTSEQMFKPCLFTTLTTFAAFGSLLISGIRPVIDFGQMMSIGVSIALILSFLAFPIVMSLLPKATIKPHKTESGITHHLAKFSEKFGNHLLLILTVIIAVSIFGVSKLSVENRFIDYFKSDTPISQGLTLIDKELGGTIPLEVIIDYIPSFDGGKISPEKLYWNDEEFRAEISKIHHYLDGLSETGKVLSADTLMQILTQANNGKKLGFFEISVIKNAIPAKAKSHLLDPYISPSNGKIRLVARIKETNKDLKRNDLINKIHHYLTKTMGYKADTFHITGMLVLYNNMLQSLFDSQIKTIAVVFTIIFLMFLFIFKSLSLSILAIIPNILPSLFILGIMGLMGISLDLMTITIAAIAIGIGVDNAIHYIHRFKFEFQKDHNYLATMYRSHHSIGLAMFYTSITVTLGFLILVLSNFIPSIYFGIFTATAMLSAMLANLTLLPKLILIFKPKI